jgi:opacity protein-like surface antigen
MKGPVLARLSLAPACLLASACATANRAPAAMPEWSPAETGIAPAAAPRDVDDDHMRVPRPDGKEDKLWPAQGLYVGGELITAKPLGDFDGDLAFAGPTDLVLIPDLDLGGGGGLYVSYRWRMNELQVEYSITEHDGSFPGSPRDHDTTFKNLDVNWRHYFWEKSPLQPYGLLGLGVTRADVDDGSTDQATGTVFQDAKLSDGISVNVGAGAALYTLPWVVFYGQGMYRFTRFKTSDGIDGEFSNSPDVDGDTWVLSVGAAIRLLPGRN